MNKSMLILGITCAGLASASGYLWKEMRTQRERAQALQTQVAELQNLQKAPPSGTDAPRDTAPATAAEVTAVSQVPVTAARIAPTALSPAPNETPRIRHFDGFEQRQRLLKDPEYRKLMLAQQRMSLSRMHPDLMSALGISREQTDQLLDLLAEQQMRSMENRPPIRATSGPPDEAALNEMRRYALEQGQSNETELAALLGDAKLAEWKEYQGSMGARMQVNHLRDLLSGGDSALRQDQIQPLVAAIAQEQRRVLSDNGYNDGGYNQTRPIQAMTMTVENRTRMMEESIERTSASNQRIHDAASAILSSDQLDSLDEMLEQNLNMQRMNVRMMRAQAEAAERGEVPAASMGVVSSEVVAVGP